MGETTADIQALPSAAPAMMGPGVIIPLRNQKLFHWCLAHGLRVSYLFTHMTVGDRRAPIGAFIPSVYF